MDQFTTRIIINRVPFQGSNKAPPNMKLIQRIRGSSGLSDPVVSTGSLMASESPSNSMSVGVSGSSEFGIWDRGLYRASGEDERFLRLLSMVVVYTERGMAVVEPRKTGTGINGKRPLWLIDI